MMKNTIKIIGLITAVVIYQACKPKQLQVEAPVEKGPYRASVTHVNDLVHTCLEVEPDFAAKELKGTAVILLKPHFYPVDSLILNAKYMRIESIEMLGSGKLASFYDSAHPVMKKWLNATGQGLQYGYDSLFLRIKLDRTYTRTEHYAIRIRYVAQPEKVRQEGSQAIHDAKGMYFINTDGKEKKKPLQVWTQGETEASSCWFPTIDVPNQKTSEEIFVTVPEQYKTISNGRLVSSEKKAGDKRTDYWLLEHPHAPYLFALVIGDFAEVKDQWRGKEVNYYVEPEYEQYARMVFGNTPEMMEFYSRVLGFDYPWDKFHQVVVRDFVSGAMENTSIVVHFDKLQHNSREHLDAPFEDIVAHELFHHWFGDLLTCESWSNIPLNESFATYGEYLWIEHKYGRDEADHELGNFHEQYFTESGFKNEDLIRYYYGNKEEMFDAHSYQKGGSVLHMLRKYVGDDAFFASLKLYVNRNAYKTVELSNLRTAFEEVTGEDLNWFFSQWFLDSGHPSITVYHELQPVAGKYAITVAQHGKTYKLPVDVDIYEGDKITRKRITVEKDSQTFYLDAPSRPTLVIFDAQNQLLADITEKKPISYWEEQMNRAPHATQRIVALGQLTELQTDKKKNVAYCRQMMKDKYWDCRAAGISQLGSLGLPKDELRPLLDELKQIANNDKKAAVRKETVSIFKRLDEQEQLKKMLEDSSYSVAQKALGTLALGMDEHAEAIALAYAENHRDEIPGDLQSGVFIVLGRRSSKDESKFLLEKIENGDEKTSENAAVALAYFLMDNRQLTGERPAKTDAVISKLTELADAQSIEPHRNSILTAMSTMRDMFYYRSLYTSMSLSNMQVDKNTKKRYQELIAGWEATYKQLDEILKKRGVGA